MEMCKIKKVFPAAKYGENRAKKTEAALMALLYAIRIAYGFAPKNHRPAGKNAPFWHFRIDFARPGLRHFTIKY